MLPAVPYLDVPGYLARTKVAPQDVTALAALYPGYIEHRIARASSWINARLQKRYQVPLGKSAPQLIAVGTAPPPIVLTGRPVIGSEQLALEVLVPGPLGTSTFWWSADGGLSWTLGSALAASGTTPPAVTVSGQAQLGSPGLLRVAVTLAGVLGVAQFAWSSDGGVTWNLAAPMTSSGTTPPGVSLTGTSSVATPSNVRIQITTAGALGTAIFEWSQDGGVTWTTGLQTTAAPVPLGATGLSANFSLGNYATNNLYEGQGIATAASYALGATGLTLSFPAGSYSANDAYQGQGIAMAATVVLGATGLTAAMPVGTYGADNTFAAPTPIPEIALGWVVAMVDVDVWQRRGANAADPTIVDAKAERDAALAEIKEAADSAEGLFELPTNDQSGDAPLVRSTPLSYTEASPFVSADWMQQQAEIDDCVGMGSYGGGTTSGSPWPPPPPSGPGEAP